MIFATSCSVFILSIAVAIAAQGPIVFFPYLNGKSTDRLRPNLTTTAGMDTVLLFSSIHPEKAIGYKYSGYYRYTGFLVEETKLDTHAFRFRLVPGLSGQVRSVSFQSRSDPTRYLRHLKETVYLHQNDNSEAFNSSATWVERYAMDGSSGRMYEAVSHPYYYLTGSSSVLKIGVFRFNTELQKYTSWNIRGLSDSNVVWTRSNKKQEMKDFSGGTILYSRYTRTMALGLGSDEYTRAYLIDRNIGKYDTRFRIVRGLTGDKNAISFQYVELENFYLTLVYMSGRHYLCSKRYEDTHTFKQMASLFPVSALDTSQGFSFLSAYLMDSYMCAENNGYIWLKHKEHNMKYSQECSWDLRVVDKYGAVWNTNWEDLRYSQKGPEVLGEETGIPLGSDLLHRPNEVLTGNTLAWIKGLPYNSPCVHEGPRCSMGLVCKKNICQTLDTTLHNLPVESPPDHQSGNVGDFCEPNSEIKCVTGTKCTQEGGEHFCLPSDEQPVSNSARFYIKSATVHRIFFSSAQEVAILEAQQLESSVLNPDQFSSRSQSVLESINKYWAVGLGYKEKCEHENSRCTLGLTCKVDSDNIRKCLSISEETMDA